MTLLAPLTAIIAGAIGGSLLLVMYMLRLRRRPVRVSTTMFWTDPPKELEANIPLRMVRPAWTLLLQALAIGLLALALGRPAMDMDAAEADRVYIVIDRSASMSAADAPGGRSRLDHAKAEALGIAEAIGGLGGSRAMVVAFGSHAEGLTAMTADRGTLQGAIRAIEPTDEAGDLDAALELIAALLTSQSAEGEAVTGSRIVLFSDGAFPLSGPRQLPGAAIEFRPLGSPGPGRDNTAIAALAAEREPTGPATVRVFVRLTSMRPEPTPVSVILRLDGEELSRRAAVIPAATIDPAAEPFADSQPRDSNLDFQDPGQQLLIFHPPAELSLSLEFIRPTGGVLTAEIDRPDLLAADNHAAVVLPSVHSPFILVVSPDQPDQFMLDVLEEIAPGRVRVIPAEAYDTPGASELIDRADLLVLDRFAPALVPDKPTLTFGAPVDADGLRAALGPDGAPRSTGETMAATWDRAHPTLSEVTLDPLLVSRVLALDDGPRRILATGADGPLIVESATSPRRIVVAFALHDSNWPLTVGFPIFLATAVEHLVYGGSPGRARSFRAGEAIAVEAVAPELASQDVVALDAEGRTAARGPSITLPRAGVYQLRGGSESVPLAINLGDESESRLDTRPALSIAGQTVAGSITSPHPIELWSWFVLAAAAVLLLEWVVYLRVARA